MHLHDGGIHFDGLDLDAHNLLALQLLEDLIQHTILGRAIHAGIDRVPGAETLGQSAPFAALLGDEEQGVEELQVGHFHIAALPRQAGLDAMELRFADLHLLTIPQTIHLVLTKPRAAGQGLTGEAERSAILAGRKDKEDRLIAERPSGAVP